MIRDEGIENFPHKFIWTASVPPKINFLLWRVVHERLYSQDMMQHKGIDIHSSCILYGDCPETKDHVLTQCKVAHKVWTSITPNDNWSWVVPDSMINLANTWSNNNFSFDGKVIWELIPAAVVWVLWRERNCFIFEDKYCYKTDEDLCREAESLVLN